MKPERRFNGEGEARLRVRLKGFDLITYSAFPNALRAMEKEIDKITTVLKGCESRGIKEDDDALEKAETGNRKLGRAISQMFLH